MRRIRKYSGHYCRRENQRNLWLGNVKSFSAMLLIRMFQKVARCEKY